jgi:hypothetical protein
MELQISEELAGAIQKEAEARGITVEDFLKSAIQRERSLAERHKIGEEQEWWENHSLKERARYAGEYIAIHNKRLVDHDKNESKLYARVREKFGNIPVLIMPAEGPQDIRIFSPRISS